MNTKFGLFISIIVLFLLCGGLLFSGPVSGSSTSGTWGGPIYDWLEPRETTDRVDTDRVPNVDYARPNHRDYDLSRDAELYFAGGLFDENAVVAREVLRIFEEDNGKNSVEDLDVTEGDPTEQEATAALDYLDELLEEDRNWRFQDHSFEEPPVDDISSWNRQNYMEWVYPASGTGEYPSEGSLAPENRILHTETMDASPSGPLDPSQNELWAYGLHVSIFSMDPSAWILQERSSQLRDSGERVVTDNSEYVVGDSGNLRAVFSGYRADKPQDEVPSSPSEGDTKVEFRGGDIEFLNDRASLEVPGHDVEAQASTIDQASSSDRSAGTIFAQWNHDNPSASAGEQATFVLTGEYEVSYNRYEYTYEYDIDPSLCEDEDNGGNGGGGGSGPDPPQPPPSPPIGPSPIQALGSGFADLSATDNVRNLPSACPAELEPVLDDISTVSQTETVSHERDVKFSSSLFMDDSDPEERFNVTAARYPNNETEYYIEKDANSVLSEGDRGQPEHVEPISSVQVGLNTVTTNWEYFSSRDHGWDTTHQQYDETTEDIRERLKDEVYVDQDNQGFASRTRPLEVYTYPRYQRPSTENQTILDESELQSVEELTRFNNPAMLAHEQCQMNYPIDQPEENYPWGGEYYDVEFCGWTLAPEEQALPVEFHESIVNRNWRTRSSPSGYNFQIKNEDFHTMYSGLSEEDEYYTGEYTMYDSMVINVGDNLQESVEVNSILGTSEEVEVQDTYDVLRSDLELDLIQITDPVDDPESIEENPFLLPPNEGLHPYVEVRPTLHGIDVSESNLFGTGEEIPINTSERTREEVVITAEEETEFASADRFSARTEEIVVDTLSDGQLDPDHEFVGTNDSGDSVIYVVPQNTNEMNVEVTAEYNPCHWSEIEDGSCNISGSDRTPYTADISTLDTFTSLPEEADTSFEEQILVFVLFFGAVVLMVTKILEVMSIQYNPCNHVSEFIPSWIKIIVTAVIAFGIITGAFDLGYSLLILVSYTFIIRIGKTIN